MREGPLFWVDSADSHPCMGKVDSQHCSAYNSRIISWTGTASAIMWTLRAEGRLFHSGLPHKGINSMELAMEAMAYIQNKFYQDFPPVGIG